MRGWHKHHQLLVARAQNRRPLSSWALLIRLGKDSLPRWDAGGYSQTTADWSAMLGRKNYTQEEVATGKATIERQLAAYDALEGATANGAREAFAERFFNNLLLALDRYYVHRLAGPNYEGKDGNPLNEVRIICDSLITNGGKMRADKQIKLPPEKSLAGLAVGDEIVLTREQFERLSQGFFAELERRFS